MNFGKSEGFQFRTEFDDGADVSRKFVFKKIFKCQWSKGASKVRQKRKNPAVESDVGIKMKWITSLSCLFKSLFCCKFNICKRASSFLLGEFSIISSVAMHISLTEEHAVAKRPMALLLYGAWRERLELPMLRRQVNFVAFNGCLRCKYSSSSSAKTCIWKSQSKCTKAGRFARMNLIPFLVTSVPKMSKNSMDLQRPSP